MSVKYIKGKTRYSRAIYSLLYFYFMAILNQKSCSLPRTSVNAMAYLKISNILAQSFGKIKKKTIPNHFDLFIPKFFILQFLKFYCVSSPRLLLA